MTVLIQLAVCISAATYDCLWVEIEGSNYSYLGYDYGQDTNTNFQKAIVAFMLWFIALMNFVSISLLVTLEMVKLMQGYFIE